MKMARNGWTWMEIDRLYMEIARNGCKLLELMKRIENGWKWPEFLKIVGNI